MELVPTHSAAPGCLLHLSRPRLSPAGQLPVLDFNGTRVQDSSEIIAFLEIHVPTPSGFPSDTEQRALSRLLEDWVDESPYWYLLAALLARGPWLVGESKSIADIAVSAQLNAMMGSSSGASRILQNPRLGDWLSRCT